MQKSISLLLACALGLGATGAAAATAAGEVLLITGRGTATDPADGSIRDLGKGASVYSGEVINSSANSYINLKFADGGYILLRPNTRFAVEDFAQGGVAAPAAVVPPAPVPPAVQPAAPSRRAYFRLLKGGFRAVSGLIGKSDPAEYRVSTPVATIGIRGTDYLVILCDAACANDPVVLDALPEGSGAQGGLIVGVIQGGVFVVNEDGKVAEVAAGQYLVTLPDGTQIYLPFEPRFLRIDPIPNPLTLCEQE